MQSFHNSRGSDICLNLYLERYITRPLSHRCCILYTSLGNCSPSQFNKLELIHERAARIIFNLPRNVNMLQKANLRPLEYIYKKQVATLMHDIYYEKAPHDLLNLSEKQSQTRTKQKHCLEIFRTRTGIR